MSFVHICLKFGLHSDSKESGGVYGLMQNILSNNFYDGAMVMFAKHRLTLIVSMAALDMERKLRSESHF